MAHYIGFDLGGTKMMATVFDSDLRIVGRDRRQTNAQEGADVVFSRIVRSIKAACKDAGVHPKNLDGIGIGCPGPINLKKGMVEDAHNLGMKNFMMQEKLEKAFGCPCAMDNDVTLGTYGEYHFGAAQGAQNVVGLFPGTGLGGGLVLNGRIYHGASGNAGEVGHVVIQPDGPLCGCGQFGCLEALASRTAITKDVYMIMMRGGAPTLREEVGKDISKIKSGALSRAFIAGDEDVRQVVLRAARYLGMGMANLVNLLNPEIIVLGGGVVEAMPKEYIKTATKAMKKYAMESIVKDVKVVEAKLGDDAGVYGAARLIVESLK